MYYRRSLRTYIGHIFYVYNEAASAVFMLFGAILELACGWQIGFDNAIGILGWHGAVLFTAIALLDVLHIVRAENRFAAFVHGVIES